jgi:hypothetical protein
MYYVGTGHGPSRHFGDGYTYGFTNGDGHGDGDGYGVGDGDGDSEGPDDNYFIALMTWTDDVRGAAIDAVINHRSNT